MDIELRSKIKKNLKIFGLVSLVAAYIIGHFIEEQKSLRLMTDSFPNVEFEKIYSSPDVYSVKSGDYLGKYIVVNVEQGWGGPFIIVSVITDSGYINEIKVLTHKETPSFFVRLQNNKFFKQFVNKKISDEIEIENDIQAVSGATVSSKAFTKSLRSSSHYVARAKFNLAVIDKPADWNLGANEFILIVLYAIVYLSVVKKYRKLRMPILIFSVVFVGFILNNPISISNFAAIMLGYFPSMYDYTLWYIVIIGTILLTAIYGKNIYCYWICPFGGLQEAISLIGGIKIKINKKMAGYLQNLVYFFFWLSMMIAFLTSNPGAATFEPFTALFSLNGIGVQWYLVSIAILGSFLVPRFWCRFFCPVGVLLNQLSKSKKKVLTVIPKLRPSN